MVEKALSGGDALMKKLEQIAQKMGGGAVSIGFLEGATYPDGTPVAAVAFWNEFGQVRFGANAGDYTIPARPFFRKMIATESPSWPEKMAKLAKATDYDGDVVLGMMGEDIKGALQQSINDLREPILAQSTVRQKGFDKPLIDTGHMLNSVQYEVQDKAGAITGGG